MSWLDVPNSVSDTIKNTVKQVYLDHIRNGGTHEDIVCAIYSAVYTGIFLGQVDVEMKK